MSVADQSVPLANLSRRIPFTVRFSPQFVNRMCDRLQRLAPARSDVAGLLFGRSEVDVSEIQVFRSFPDVETNAPQPEQLGHLAARVESLVASSRKDPEISSLQLLGWYSFRATGGLHESDVAFHNHYFGQPNEIALILRPEQHPNVLFEIYSKSGTTPLSEEEHRWGSLRLPTDATVAGPVDIAMRAKIGDEFYLRAYQVSKTLDRAERREQWANAVEATKSTVRSLFRQKRKETYARDAALAAQAASKVLAEPATPTAPLARAAAATAAEAPAANRPAVQRFSSPAASPLQPSFASPGRDRGVTLARESGAMQRIYAGDPPGVPAVIKPPRRGVPWLSSFIVAAIAAGATFAFVYHAEFAAGGETPSFLRAIFPDTGLGLRVEGQGDRVLLSWNRRNAIVRSSQGGVLHIDDGTQHRDVPLDRAQIANGSVLYRPGSDDVSFRLEVHGQQGAAVTETMRVLDGAKAPPLEVRNAPPDVSASTPPPAQPTTVASNSESRPTRDTAPPPAAVHPSPLPAEPSSRLAERARMPEYRSAESRATSNSSPDSLAPATSSTPSRSGPSVPNTPALAASRPAQTTTPPVAAPQETRPSSTPPPAQTLSETPKPSVPIPDTSHQPDTSKVSNWEEPSSRKAAEPSPSRTAPNAPAPTTPPALTVENPPAPTFTPPKPLRQVLPDLRSFTPGSIGSTSQVEIDVKVNKKGHVTDAYLVGDSSKVPPHLAHAALVAAKKWTFQPATVRGKNVPSDHTIVFEFRPASHQ